VDNRTDIMALDLDAQVLANPGHLSMSQLKESLSTQVQQLLQLPAPVVWKEHAGKAPLFLTDILEPNLAPPKGAPAQTYKPWVRYGLVPLPKDLFVLFGFSVTVPADQERKLYESVIDRMIDSLATGSPRPAAPAQKAG
jgi:hypothetical protein